MNWHVAQSRAALLIVIATSRATLQSMRLVFREDTRTDSLFNTDQRSQQKRVLRLLHLRKCRWR